MIRDVNRFCGVEETDFHDNCLDFEHEDDFEDDDHDNDGDEYATGSDIICPYCGNEVELDQAYLGGGECLCPYCSARFACL